MNENIVYFGAGTIDSKNLIRYFIVLPIEEPENDYDFQLYNFSSSDYNRLLVHMKPKASGSSNDLSDPAHWPQNKLYLPMIERTLTGVGNADDQLQDGTLFLVDAPMEIILYHNDTLDSHLWTYYRQSFPIFNPKKAGFGTLQKI